MGIIRRRRGGDEDGPVAEPDPEFRYFSRDQGAQFRALARQVFAEQGVETVVYPTYLEAQGGQRYGLHNLAAACHGARRGETDWPDVVKDHAERILRATSGPVPFEAISTEDVLAHTYLRVLNADSLPSRDSFGYARELADGLLEVFALDQPETVVMFRDEEVERFGLDPLREAGLTNLLAEPLGSHEVVSGFDESKLHVVMGESVFTASKVLVIRDVLRRTIADTDTPHGILVCMPFRHQLAFHVPRDASAVPALQSLAGFAANGYEDGVGALSPFVYWWQDGRLQQLSRADEDGALRVEVDGEFGSVLGRLLREGE
ncbi:MAG: hypothetical protein QOJ50_1935 [Cryptosporangiaceae bacterium]|nr:hypothetical protein [Cryptosporangiaceae bacterium]